MRTELTDAMIAKELANVGMRSIVLGVCLILAAIIIFIISRKNRRLWVSAQNCVCL